MACNGLLCTTNFIVSGQLRYTEARAILVPRSVNLTGKRDNANPSSLATQWWSDGCVVRGVCLFQDKAKVWRVKSVFSTVECGYLLYK